MELSKIDPKVKRDFLAKLQSGKFTLAPGREKGEAKTFHQTDTGDYQCDKTGEILTRDGIETLAGKFDFCVEVIDSLGTPAKGFHLFNINHSEGSILDTLLIPKW